MRVKKKLKSKLLRKQHRPDFTFAYTVDKDSSAWIEVYIDDEVKEAGEVTGPSSQEYKCSSKLEFVAGSPEGVSVTINGEKQTISANENGIVSVTFSFDDILDKWYEAHPDVKKPSVSDSAAKAKTTSNSSTTNSDSSFIKFYFQFRISPCTRRTIQERILMAKDSSFDVVSQIDLQEVDNAYGQAKKELAQRYDLKDTGSEISFDKNAKTVTIKAPSDFVVKQVMDIFTSKLVKRGIDLTSLKWGKLEAATGGTVRQTATLIEGIDRETAGKINKDIKGAKLKVKVTIEGDKLRVSGPKLDTLQEVIAFLKGNDYGQPLQFVNYR